MENIAPISYDIHLVPHLDDFTFEGKVWFKFTAEDLHSVTLDICDLKIADCCVGVNGAYVPVQYKVNNATVTCFFSAPLNGEHSISVAFDGQINNLMAGFYRSVYKHAGKDGLMATTQFEESDARRAFPCMDHPQYKAVFNITMDLDKNLTAIANTNIAKEVELWGGVKRVVFEPTPKMSTYLVFFGIGEFELKHDATDKRIRTAVLPGKSGEADIARDFAAKALKYCEDYYGVPYSIDKLDLIAVPDFAFGAMENWGAMTFRENLLYYHAGTTSKAGLERICEVIAHEIVHQWFGNLVTPVDWKYLWLNESFATYFGYAATDFYHKDWLYWHKFLTDETSIAMERDSLIDTIPIEIPTGDQVIIINSSTAPIIYNKGGSLMLMLEDFIGNTAFQKALQAYLKKFAYACAETEDLLQVFDEVTQKDIASMLRKWIQSKGFPQIAATAFGNKIVFNQNRFTYLPNNSETLWPVPLTIKLFYKDGTQEIKSLLLENKTSELVLDKTVAAFHLNVGRKGFYRCLYTEENFLQLAELAADNQLAPADRWGLVGDLFAAIKAGQIAFELFKKIHALMRYESDPLALGALVGVVNECYLVLPSMRANLAQKACPLLEEPLHKIGLEPQPNEPNYVAALRDRLLWGALFMGNDTVTNFLTQKFYALMQGQSIHPDIVKNVMQAGALNLGREAFDWLLARFQTSEVEHERLNILAALGCVRDPQEIEEVLEFVITKVPPRNQVATVAAMGQNPFAKDALWPWYRNNLDRIEQFHPMLYERVVAAIITYAASHDMAEIQKFFAEYTKQKALARDIIKLSLEKLSVYENLRRRA